MSKSLTAQTHMETKAVVADFLIGFSTMFGTMALKLKLTILMEKDQVTVKMILESML